MKEYYNEYNTLERGEGAVMKESKKVRGWVGEKNAADPMVWLVASGGRLVVGLAGACSSPLLNTPPSSERLRHRWRSKPELHSVACPIPLQVADLVDKFYSLVTDLYEWGWGQSFHFSRKLPNRDWTASEVAHEAWAAATIRLG